VFGADGPPANMPAHTGWGLGSFGVRERERGAAEAAYEMEGIEGLIRRERSRAEDAEGEGDVPEEEMPERTERREGEPQHLQPAANQTPEEASASLWWWGPLRRWRHQDTTEYSER